MTRTSGCDRAAGSSCTISASLSQATPPSKPAQIRPDRSSYKVRARYITNQVADWERLGDMPRLVLICLPNDHTSGTSKDSPTLAAMVADNDLALGQITEALSHSRLWKSMAIFGTEDDPKNGWDHVSGYRTTTYVISPWAKQRVVVKTRYNTTSLLRTMEQILGLPPMSQFDATATPMADCFTDFPNFTSFTAVANNVALDEMNPDPKAIHDPHFAAMPMLPLG
jgi:Phosphoesterase family